jgi:RHS repeat-associated protein
VVQLTGADGLVVKNYDYDAFGNEKNIDVEDANPFRYCGEYQDSSSGLVYLRARYYNPATSRMLSEDPARDGLNWYTYCGNDPINYIDPTGYIREPGYVNGVWSQDPDAYEFGADSVTYASLVVLGNNWNNATTQQRGDIEGLALTVRNTSRDLQVKGKSLVTLSAPTSIVGGGQINPVERILYEGNGWEGGLMVLNGGVAAVAAVASFNDGHLDNTNGNAFKHAYWNALMTVDMGYDSAKKWGDAHEFGAKDNIGSVSANMDLYNNEVGRQEGNSHFLVYAQLIANEVSAGNLKRVVNGNLQWTNSDSFRLKINLP